MRSTGTTPQAVIVEAVVRRQSSGEVVDSLLLRTLAGLSSLATFATAWDAEATGRAAPGLYDVDVTLRDAAGDVLDSARAEFTLGVTAGELAGLTAEPQILVPGRAIDVRLSFRNTGSVPLAGTAVIRVRPVSGKDVKSFTHDFAALAPGGVLHFEDRWDTTGIALGSYRVVAHVLFDGQATEPASVPVRSPVQLYLPMVFRN